MAKTTVPIELSSTPSIVDNGNATAITITSNEDIGLGTNSITNNTLGPTIYFGNGTSMITADSSSPRFWLGNNWYYNSGDKFIGTGYANLYSQQSGEHIFLTSSASGTAGASVSFNTVMKIDSSGNVGIGTSSPSGILHLYKASGTTDLRIQSNQYSANYGFVGGALGTNALGIYDYGASAYRFVLDSSGNVGINKTPTTKLEILGSASNAASQIQVGTNGYPAISFLNAAGTQQGYITTNASSVSYTSVSDYRLKENVTYDWDATTRLKQLKPARFNFIADADTTVDGFLAHEVSSIVPEAIHGEKDEMQTEEYEATPAVLDDDGNVVTEAVMGTREVPKYQGIDQSKLVPLLVKTIQELEARITALENA